MIIAGHVASSEALIGAVVAPTITASAKSLCSNAHSLHVAGTNLPAACPQATAEVLLSGGLVYGVDFLLAHCTRTGFMLQLREGRRWGSSGNAV